MISDVFIILSPFKSGSCRGRFLSERKWQTLSMSLHIVMSLPHRAVQVRRAPLPELHQLNPISIHRIGLMRIRNDDGKNFTDKMSGYIRDTVSGHGKARPEGADLRTAQVRGEGKPLVEAIYPFS